MRSRLALLSCLSVPALLWACGSGASSDDQPGVWFVHATDPHVFEEPEYAEAQEPINQRAFRRLLETLETLPDSDAEPAFLLLTGDLGFGEEAGEREEGGRESRIRRLAELLSARPDLDVYWVPGNKDIRDGEPSVALLREAHLFLAAVQERVSAQGITLHDLTACYLGDPGLQGPCTADIAGTRFRLIGFPTSSFTYRQPDTDDGEDEGQRGGTGESMPPAPDDAGTLPVADRSGAGDGAEGGLSAAGSETGGGSDRKDLHGAWMERLAGLVEAAGRDGKRVLVATHIPELNDPYLQAQALIALPSAGPVRVPSAWRVPAELFERWRGIVASPTVARVLAGHFHDPHREIYRPPYTWEHDPPGAPVVARADRGKIWLAPPLGIRLQDASPIQARGFALIGLAGSHIERRLYWYDAVRDAFTRETPEVAAATGGGPSRPLLIARAWRWFWNLPGPDQPLQKSAVLLIALTAAFLTIVAVWRIPPPDTRLASSDPKGAKDDAGAPVTKNQGPFDNNFANTVLGGLSGLVGVAFIDTFWESSDLDLKTFYIVCYLALFLILLLLYSVLRGVAEVTRSRVASGQRVEWQRWRKPEAGQPQPARRLPQVAASKSGKPSNETQPGQPEPKRKAGGEQAVRSEQTAEGENDGAVLWPDRGESRSGYWVRRFGRWVLSLRSAFLVFFDTVFNVIQGRNQLETAVLGKTIVDLQESLVATVDRIAEEIQRAIRYALAEEGCTIGLAECRVNISVLAADGKSLSYVSLSRGSLQRPFGQRSVAWLAVMIGEARWWKASYEPKQEEIEIYDNRAKKLPDWEHSIKLGSVFEIRGPLDYEAFVVLPLPWFRGGREHTRGAVHISLAKEKYLDLLWDDLEFPAAPHGAEAHASLPDAASPPADPKIPPKVADPRTRPGMPTYRGWRWLARPPQGSPCTIASTPGAPPDGCAPRVRRGRLAAVLTQSLGVLPEVLRHFNMPLFEDLIKPR